jgi:hypothetical protein
MQLGGAESSVRARLAGSRTHRAGCHRAVVGCRVRGASQTTAVAQSADLHLQRPFRHGGIPRAHAGDPSSSQALAGATQRGFQLYRAYDDVNLLLVTPRASLAQLLADKLEQQPVAAAAGAAGTDKVASGRAQLATLEAAARLKLSAAQVQADVLQLSQLSNVSYVAQERFHRALGIPAARLAQATGSCPRERRSCVGSR